MRDGSPGWLAIVAADFAARGRVDDALVRLRAVLYDDREGSPTRGGLDVLHLGLERPTLLVIPPGVWHGIQNLDGTPSTFVNYFDEQYAYDNPDDWRLPPDTDEIPYRFR